MVSLATAHLQFFVNVVKSHFEAVSSLQTIITFFANDFISANEITLMMLTLLLHPYKFKPLRSKNLKGHKGTFPVMKALFIDLLFALRSNDEL